MKELIRVGYSLLHLVDHSITLAFVQYLEWWVWTGQNMDERSVLQLSITLAKGGSWLYQGETLRVLEGDPNDHSV